MIYNPNASGIVDKISEKSSISYINTLHNKKASFSVDARISYLMVDVFFGD